MPDELLRMSNISKSFPGVKALDDVSIDLHQGEVLGILGENGAGKSTLMKILAGDYAMDTGEIFIGGKRLEMHNPADAKEQGIRVIYQELNTLDTLSVAENIFVGALPDKKFSILVDWKKLYADAAGVLEKMGVQIDPRRIVGELSLHEKQIVEIAKALSAEARILVMDEPTAALGEEETESLFQTISNLRDHGVGIIYISHRMGEIFRITDRVTVLRDGVKVDTVATCDTNKDQLVAMIVGRELSEFYPKRSVPIGKVLLEARGLTIWLEQKNAERRRLTTNVLAKAREQILAQGILPLLVASDKDYPVGIAGLVASRLSEEFCRPAIVVRIGGRMSSGSCRSIPEFNIILALTQCSGLLAQFGGHSQAAGFILPTKNLARL